MANLIHGLWEKDRELPNAYVLPKKKKGYNSGRPIVSFMNAPFRPMLNCIAKLIYQLLPQACPHNLAKGDVFDLIRLLQTTNFDTTPSPLIFNQDLAGFFTSIDMPRFIDSWYLLLKFLTHIMDTHTLMQFFRSIPRKATPLGTS